MKDDAFFILKNENFHIFISYKKIYKKTLHLLSITKYIF